MKAAQEEMILLDPRRRVRNRQIELPFPDARGGRAQRLVDRYAGRRPLAFRGQIKDMDSTAMVVVACDAGQAKSLYFQRAKAGYDVKFTGVKIKRDDELDPWAAFIGIGVHSQESVDDRLEKQRLSHQKSSNDHPEMPLPVST